MCLALATRVPLADGRDHRIDDLRAAKVPGYTCSASGRVRVTYASARDGSGEAALRIVLDNELDVVCTAEQRFMMRDGSYFAARDLVVGSSLMPLYTQRDRDGYVLVQQNYSGRWQKAHWIVARCGLLGPIPRFEDQRTVIHHKNFDEADNTPSNLEFMGANDHAAFHRSIVERNEHWQSAEFEARRVEALAAKAATPEGHAYFAARGTRNIKAYMEQRPEHFRAAVAGNGKRGAPLLASYNKSEKGRQKSREMSNAMYPCELCGEYVKSYIGLFNHRRAKHGFNHRVVSIERVAEPHQLICITGAEPANFALAAGIFAACCSGAKQPRKLRLKQPRQ